jgi:hypothetical protein
MIHQFASLPDVGVSSFLSVGVAMRYSGTGPRCSYGAPRPFDRCRGSRNNSRMPVRGPFFLCDRRNKRETDGFSLVLYRSSPAHIK